MSKKHKEKHQHEDLPTQPEPVRLTQLSSKAG